MYFCFLFQDYEEDLLKFTLFYVYFALTLCQLVLACIPETLPPSPGKVGVFCNSSSCYSPVVLSSASPLKLVTKRQILRLVLIESICRRQDKSA